LNIEISKNQNIANEYNTKKTIKLREMDFKNSKINEFKQLIEDCLYQCKKLENDELQIKTDKENIINNLNEEKKNNTKELSKVKKNWNKMERE